MSDPEQKPELGDAIAAVTEAVLAEEHGDVYATVQSYDQAKQRATVVPVLKFVVDRKVVPAGAIPNVPVCFPSCAAGAITWPLVKDDLVKLEVVELDHGKWLADGKTGEEPASWQRHALSPGYLVAKPDPARPLVSLLTSTQVAADGLVLAFSKIYFRDNTATDALALASKVEAALQAHIDEDNAHVHTHPQGNTTGLVNPYTAAQSVGSANLLTPEET